jgi:hypothetical protein
MQATRVLGLPRWRQVLRHLLPNCLPPLIVVATVQVAHAISLEATLSFFGLGLPITEPSLGLLISNGFSHLISGQLLDQLLPGRGAAADHPVDQPGGRPAARRPQPEAAPMSTALPLLQVESLSTHFATRQGVVRAVQDVSFTLRAGPGARAGGRVGLGQVHHRAVADGPRGAARPPGGRRASSSTART